MAPVRPVSWQARSTSVLFFVSAAAIRCRLRAIGCAGGLHDGRVFQPVEQQR
jgi:hypothetical protein